MTPTVRFNELESTLADAARSDVSIVHHHHTEPPSATVRFGGDSYLVEGDDVVALEHAFGRLPEPVEWC